MDTTRTEQSGLMPESQTQPNPQASVGIYERKLSARQEKNVAELAERLYDFMPPVCWMTEAHLAEALGTNTWQIKKRQSLSSQQRTYKDGIATKW
jgi:hypothetical protein